MTTIIELLELLIGREYEPLRNLESYFYAGLPQDFDTRFLSFDVEWIACAVIVTLLIFWCLKGLFRLISVIKG